MKQLKDLKPELEIGWDGGVDEKNALPLVEAGVDVLNVGGFIQNSSHPESAYATLDSIVKQTKNEDKTDA